MIQRLSSLGLFLVLFSMIPTVHATTGDVGNQSFIKQVLQAAMDTLRTNEEVRIALQEAIEFANAQNADLGNRDLSNIWLVIVDASAKQGEEDVRATQNQSELMSQDHEEGNSVRKTNNYIYGGFQIPLSFIRNNDSERRGIQLNRIGARYTRMHFNLNNGRISPEYVGYGAGIAMAQVMTPSSELRINGEMTMGSTVFSKGNRAFGLAFGPEYGLSSKKVFLNIGARLNFRSQFSGDPYRKTNFSDEMAHLHWSLEVNVNVPAIKDNFQPNDIQTTTTANNIQQKRVVSFVLTFGLTK